MKLTSLLEEPVACAVASRRAPIAAFSRLDAKTCSRGKGVPWQAFADTAVACVENNAREESSRQAVPAGGDLWSDEDRRPGVGARSALRGLTRRSCLSAVSEANAASSATRLWGEHRSAVGAQRRPRKHEPPPGTAWRDAQALQSERASQAIDPARDAQAPQTWHAAQGLQIERGSRKATQNASEHRSKQRRFTRCCGR